MQEERHKLRQQLEVMHKTNQNLINDRNAQVKQLTQDINRISKEYELQVHTKKIRELRKLMIRTAKFARFSIGGSQ